MNYSAFDYVLISISNAAGLDKLLFEDRIAWCKNQGKALFTYTGEDEHLYKKGIQELSRLIQGKTDSHYMVALDGCSSGTQLLACLSGCITSASQCGLVDPNKRCDVYTELANVMNEFLPKEKHIGINPDGFSRQDLKEPFMCFFYGSRAIPKAVFGEGTPELKAFYQAIHKMAPGACSLMDDLGGAIDVERTRYNWTLPDGFEVKTIVEVPVDMKVELEELKTATGKASTFTHRVYREGQDPYYKAVQANSIHSCDAFVVREMKRRAGAPRKHLQGILRDMQYFGIAPDLYASKKCLSLTRASNWRDEPTDIQQKLMAIIEQIVDYPEFDIVTVHDSFAAAPAHMNMVRFLYKELLAEIAESDLLQDMLREIYEDISIVYNDEGDRTVLAHHIRNSEYALS